MLRAEARTRVGSLDLDVALEVPAGRVLALAGPSGAGKSTVLRVVAGLSRPEAGRVTCGEEVWLDTVAGVNRPPEARRCGFLFQDYALFPFMRAWQNVAFGLSEVPRGDRRRRAVALLDRFGVAALADSRPVTLSGGERQRVALARALARSPSALLLDEPLSALDTRTRAAAARELAAILRDASVPALLVTHDFAEAAQLGDEVAVMDAGRVVQRGAASNLAAAPTSAFVADFTGAVVLTGTAAPGGDGLTRVQLDGGGTLVSTDRAEGPVAASVFPWEIAIEPPAEHRHGSPQNHLDCEVITVTTLGNRVRLGLAASQPLAAEVTQAAVRELGLTPGARVQATWKAAATRLVTL